MNMLKLLINKWVILFLIVFTPIAKVFFVDAYELFIDMATLNVKQEPLLSNGPNPEIKQILFSAERNNARHINVSETSLISRSTDQAEISVRIKSIFPGNDFPILVAKIKSKDGGERTVEVKPTEYKHSDKFTDEIVTVKINLMPGDSKFLITPTY